MKEENVWSYPRPAACEPFVGEIRVEHGGEALAHSRRTHRVLETSHPPVYYLPPGDVDMGRLRANARRSMCEWKGQALYYDLVDGDGIIVANVAWTYPQPTPAFEAIRNHLAFYPSKVDACFVNDEQAAAQEGDFYGGWITANLKGPFKGAPGTLGW